MFGLGIPEIIIILLAIGILLFGSKKIVELARSMGRFTGEFKKGKHDIESEIKNAEKDEDLYKDALVNLLEAEKREKTDYFVLHRIGLIYLYSPKLLNIEKAEDYFKRAAKYAIVESDPDSAKIADVLMGDIRARLIEKNISLNSIKQLAAESYYQAGIACFLLEKYTNSAEFAGKAFSLAPQLLEAGFTQAKSLTFIGDMSLSTEVLERVIKSDRSYALKVASDSDFASREEIYFMLERLRSEAVQISRNLLDKIKEKAKKESQANKIFIDIEKFLNRNTYFEALHALDEIKKVRNWNMEFSLSFQKSSRLQTLAGYYSSDYNQRYFSNIIFSPDSKYIAALENSYWSGERSVHSYSIKIIDIYNDSLLQIISYNSSFFPENITFHPKGVILVATIKTEVIFFDLISGEKIDEFTGPTKFSFSPSTVFSTNGNKFGILFSDGIHVYDSHTRNKMGIISEFGNFRFSIDDERLIVFGSKTSIYNLNSFHKEREFDFYSEYISRDLKNAAKIEGNDIVVFNIPKSKVFRLRNHTSSVNSLCFSQNGLFLISAGKDNRIIIWNLTNYEKIKELNLPNRKGNYFYRLVYSPNDKVIICLSSGEYSDIELWHSEQSSETIYFSLDELVDFENQFDDLNRCKLKNIENVEKISKAIQFFKAAEKEKLKQDKKWLFKKYSKAIEYYNKAADLGSTFSKEQADYLTNL